jgi:hypothetical protein
LGTHFVAFLPGLFWQLSRRKGSLAEVRRKDPFFGAQLIVTPYFSLLFKSHRKMLPIHQGSSWLKEDWNDKDPQENRRSQSTTGHSHAWFREYRWCILYR